MSEEPARKPRTSHWIVSGLAALFLYAASWPLVELETSQIDHSLKIDGIPYYKVIKPKWVSVLYRPMVLLENLNNGRAPLSQYYYWWLRVLKGAPDIPDFNF